MTKLQVKNAMRRAGITPLSLTGRAGKWEVELSSPRDAARFNAYVGMGTGGFATLYGSVILRPDYPRSATVRE